MVFQSYAIWPHKSVYDNVAFPLRMKRTPKDQIGPKVEHALKRVGLEGFAGRGASKLSGGQMQRVAFARALATESSTLLFDEPLSNLDAKLRDRLRFELREIQQEVAFTSIYVTHDQTEAMVLADRVAVMREGRIVQLDGPEDVYRKPRDAFVADFFGHVNIFAAKVDHATGSHPVARLTEWPVSIKAAMDGPTGNVSAVCLRPDALTLSTTPADGAENVWSGVVLRTTFLGTHVRHRVAISDGPEVEVLSSGAAAVPAGATAFLAIKASDVRLLVD
jgi:iron(III) transport system ATP-binding protein